MIEDIGVIELNKYGRAAWERLSPADRRMVIDGTMFRRMLKARVAAKMRARAYRDRKKAKQSS